MKSNAPAAFIGTIAPIAHLPAALDQRRVALHHRQRRSDLLGSPADEPLSEGSVTSASLTLKSADGAHSGTVSLAGEDMLVFTPSEPLALLTEYTATVHGVEAQSGALLADDHSWSFTTRDGRWGDPLLIEISNAGSGYSPRVALDPNGNAVAVWQQGDGTRYDIWANRFD